MVNEMTTLHHPAEVEAVLTYVLDGRVGAFVREPFGVLQFAVKTALGERTCDARLNADVSIEALMAVGRIDLSKTEEEICAALTAARNKAREMKND